VSVRAVEEDRRGQLADYVLGQQAGPEESATKGHLRRSEAARSWTRSLLDSLEGLYPNGSMPAVPEGERGRRAAASKAPAGAGLAAPADPAVKRRRLLAAGGALAALALVAVLLWPVGVLTDDDDEPEPAAEQAGSGGGDGQNTSAQTSGAPAGIAIVVEQNGRRQLLVQAARLEPSGQREAYEVWLYNSQGDATTLGGQVTDQQGNYQAIGNLPADFAQYRFIDISREPLDRQRNHSGDSVLRGRMPTLRAAQPQGNQKSAVLGQSVLAPPGG
jgi:Anti-sigma-K factor rskA